MRRKRHPRQRAGIAHRLTTVQQADAIWMLREGQVEQTGTYDELMQQNRSFRAFAGVAG